MHHRGPILKPPFQYRMLHTMTRSKRCRRRQRQLPEEQENQTHQQSVSSSDLQSHEPLPAQALAAWTATTVTRSQPGEYHDTSFEMDGVDIYQIVDSWRSYRDDESNLQSIAGKGRPKRLDPAAPAFEPASENTYRAAPFTPYQPLRTSTGQNEKRVVNHARAFSTLQTAIDSQISQENVHSGQHTTNTISDQVLPSIEHVDPSEKPTATTVIGLIASSTRRTRVRGSKPPSQRPISRGFSTQTPEPLPVPTPTAAYMLQAGLEPITLQQQQKLLIILDLNGTLLYRKNRAKAPASFQARPGVGRLLNYLFDNHTVMVYTSARPENALSMVDKLLSQNQRKQLVAVWARDKLDLNQAQYNNKVQVYKKLEKVWNEISIQAAAGERRCWDQSNTVLIDDSHLKAMAQPHNLLQVPEFVNDKPRDDVEATNIWTKTQQDILRQLELKLEELRWTCDVSRLIRLWQTAEKPAPMVPGQKVVVDESIDQGLLAKDPKEDDDRELEDNAQLLTPKSPEKQSVNQSIRSNASSDDEDDKYVDQQHGLRAGSVWIGLGGSSTRDAPEDGPATPRSIDGT